MIAKYDTFPVSFGEARVSAHVAGPTDGKTYFPRVLVAFANRTGEFISTAHLTKDETQRLIEELNLAIFKLNEAEKDHVE